MPARFDLLVRNGTVVTGGGRRDVDVAVIGGRVAAFGERGELGAGAAVEELDASGLLVLPGVVDGHVHFREPGLEHKEDWLSGSRAAVHGGVTTVVEMPNTRPPTRSVAAARAKLALAGAKAYCDFGLLGLLDRGTSERALSQLLESGLVVGLKVFLGPSTGDLVAPDDDVLASALAQAGRSGVRTAFHAEDAAILGRAAMATASRSDAPAHLEARPVEAEVAAIDHAGRLLLGAGAAGHILHLSSADGVEAVRRWRARGADLTCEVTPHHVFLGREAYAELGGRIKANPPVRGEPHSTALLAALADGTIDAVASDHAPHAPAEKSSPDIRRVEAGVAGVETTLPLLLEAVAAGRLSLERVVQATSEAPARAWRLWPAKGSIEPGADADLALVDLGRKRVIRGATLHGRHGDTPFEGRTVRAAVVATIVRGRLVMRDGELLAEPGWGRPVRVAASRRPT